MKLSDTSLLSVTNRQRGRSVIELVEHGTEVTMVGLIIAIDPRGRGIDMTDPFCPRQVPARHARRASSRCVTMQWSTVERRMVAVCASCSR